ncbi:hypothetical protein D3C80_1549680 [compost metagenome]
MIQLGEHIVLVDCVLEVTHTKGGEHQPRIRGISPGDDNELVVLLEPCLTRKRFLGSRKLHVVFTSMLLGLRFDDAERGKIGHSKVSKTIRRFGYRLPVHRAAPG